jgi:hypothetical protein
MLRRHFISAAALVAGAIQQASAQQPAQKNRGPALLTVSGAITRTNRGALDPALDQMMVKQKVAFDKAHAFDFASLLALPAVAIKPTLEYDAKVHTLSGPLLSAVIQAAGGPKADATQLRLRAVDGYAVTLSIADANKFRFIVATQLDGRPMPLGGLGPCWALYDADRFPEMAAKPVNQRFALCPWALYHIDVAAA